MTVKERRIKSSLKRLDELRDEDIDFSEIPEITPEQFAQAMVHRGLPVPPRKTQIALRIDKDVLAWFKAQGKGYQSRVNALLRAYMEAHQ